MITFSDPDKVIHFGSRASKTYLDHGDKDRRANYLKRHKVNETWTDPTTPGALSAFLLWGPHTDLHANLTYFLHHFNIKHA